MSKIKFCAVIVLATGLAGAAYARGGGGHGGGGGGRGGGGHFGGGAHFGGGGHFGGARIGGAHFGGARIGGGPFRGGPTSPVPGCRVCPGGPVPGAAPVVGPGHHRPGPRPPPRAGHLPAA